VGQAEGREGVVRGKKGTVGSWRQLNKWKPFDEVSGRLETGLTLAEWVQGDGRGVQSEGMGVHGGRCLLRASRRVLTLPGVL
jgi:hypothetical protein